MLEGSWEFAQPIHMCFVDLEKIHFRAESVCSTEAVDTRTVTANHDDVYSWPMFSQIFEGNQ